MKDKRQKSKVKSKNAKCKVQKLVKSNPLPGEPAPNEVRGARGGFIKGKSKATGDRVGGLFYPQQIHYPINKC